MHARPDSNYLLRSRNPGRDMLMREFVVCSGLKVRGTRDETGRDLARTHYQELISSYLHKYPVPCTIVLVLGTERNRPGDGPSHCHQQRISAKTGTTYPRRSARVQQDWRRAPASGAATSNHVPARHIGSRSADLNAFMPASLPETKP